MTMNLPALIKSIGVGYKNKVMKELNDIFQELASHSRYIPSVKYLKEEGPGEFAASQRQEDAQNYLLSLMDALEV